MASYRQFCGGGRLLCTVLLLCIVIVVVITALAAGFVNVTRLHRITGATIFFFLFVHVLAPALVRVSPQAYNSVVASYKTPIVGLMEFGLVVAVSYHALNGVRIVLIDFWSQGPRYQRLMLWIIGALWLLLMVPAAVVLGIHMWDHFR